MIIWNNSRSASHIKLKAKPLEVKEWMTSKGFYFLHVSRLCFGSTGKNHGWGWVLDSTSDFIAFWFFFFLLFLFLYFLFSPWNCTTLVVIGMYIIYLSIYICICTGSIYMCVCCIWYVIFVYETRKEWMRWTDLPSLIPAPSTPALGYQTFSVYVINMNRPSHLILCCRSTEAKKKKKRMTKIIKSHNVISSFLPFISLFCSILFFLAFFSPANVALSRDLQTCTCCDLTSCCSLLLYHTGLMCLDLCCSLCFNYALQV